MSQTQSPRTMTVEASVEEAEVTSEAEEATSEVEVSGAEAAEEDQEGTMELIELPVKEPL